MSTGIPRGAAAVAAALALTCLDVLGRHVVSTRLGAGPVPTLTGAAELFCVVGVILAAALAVRPDAIRIALPMGALLVVGDVVNVRLQTVNATEAQAGGLAAAVAFLVGLAVFRHPARLAERAQHLGWLGVLLCALPLVPGLGVSDGGQRLRAGFAGHYVMPGELGRPLLVLGFAAALSATMWAESSDLRLRECWRPLLRAARLPIAGVAVTLAAGDTGPAAVLSVAAAMTVAVYTGRVRWAIGALAISGWAFAAAALVSSRFLTRLTDVLDPFALAGHGHSQAGIAQFALAWGGWTGTGIGGGVTDPSVPGAVPLGGTDLSLAVVGMETGVVGLLVVIGLFAILVWGMFAAALEAPDGFPRLAGCALASLVTTATAWVIGAALGVLPLSGIVTPFVSGGRSGAMALAFTLALFCRLPHEGAPAQRAAAGTSERAIRILRVSAVTALAAVAAVTIARTATARLDTVRRADNPILAVHQLVRGRVLAADGTVWAGSTGSGSLDTVRRRWSERRPEIVGESELGARGTGIEGAWASALRCSGSGQASVTEPGGPVIGDPTTCRTADVQTTLDPALQQRAREVLAQGRVGAIVVLDPRDGAVLALAGRKAAPLPTPSAPDLPNPELPVPDPPNPDVSRTSGGAVRVVQQEPAQDSADAGVTMGTQTAIAPGSTFKLATALAALLDEGAPPQPWRSSWAVPGSGVVVRNAGGEVCGGGLFEALQHSCNTAFGVWAIQLGAGRLNDAARRLGIWPTPDLSGTPVAASSLGAPKDPGVLAVSGMGQGRVVATPLAMARAVATIAAGGRRPTVGAVEAVCRHGQVLARPRRASPRTFSAAAARTLTISMRAVVTGGTARRLQLDGDWAAKTGTAELPALAATGTPLGTAGWIVAFPTSGPGAGRIAVATLAMPTPDAPKRAGPADGVDMLAAIGPAAVAAARRRAHRTPCAEAKGDLLG